MIKAVIMDWAGTMVDYGSFAPVEAFRRLFRERGIEASHRAIRKPMGRMKKDHLRDICAEPDVAAAWLERYGQAPTESDIDEMYEAFEPMLMSIVHEFAEPVPGAVELADRLRGQGIKIGTTTGYTRPMLDLILPEAAKLGYTPDSTVTPDEAAAGRPEPWMVYRNAEKLGLFPMESYVKVGDTEADMQEGRNAGVWTVGVVFGGNEVGLSLAEYEMLSEGEKEKTYVEISERLTKAGAHFIIREIGELDRIIAHINNRMEAGERP
ncbi:phosphonoacetaldehyde hydrolase [Paenibacillus sp. LHD-117]|uniref:phosphonoacetaldehyde hydrolase n=1 Tax=Paenibacillus sp. LHD-117 TaxID=3071412 RepID=UPI0027E0EA87|nr:phosphonoacetaldehyde hydrolase [Paenibacillus sp. LHD-117]MDQ6420658.1 phosphonoacetaldehyde hydrolase [Paenibacillus sp. LHD-117]